MKGFLLFFTCLVVPLFGFSQNNIEVYCAEVNEDGSTTIHYQIVEGNGFYGYIISAYDFSEEAYLQVGIENDIMQGSYTDNVRNANVEQINYLVTADFGEDRRPYGGIKTMFLSYEQVSDNEINLSWTSLGSSMPEGSQGQSYKLYRKQKKQSDQWQLIAVQDERQYTDIFPPVCSDTILYKVELENVNGCVSRSNQVQIEVGDNEIPQMPDLKSVSVDQQTQMLVLNWVPSFSEDVYGYVICSGNPCVALDTVWGADAYEYYCEDCSVEELNSLAVMAIDTCFNTSLRTDSHTNIVLSADREACSDKVMLEWNPYEDFPDGVERYDIYVGYDNAVPILFSTASAVGEQITIDPSHSSCSIYVRAVSNDGVISNSNKVTLFIETAEQVDFIEIRKVSVRQSNEEVDLEFYVDASLEVSKYVLKRSADNSSYRQVAYIPYTGDNTLTHVDHLPSSATGTMYSYILEAPDACGLLYKASEPAFIMQLSLEEIDMNTNRLTWTPYVSWENTVGSYEIYRQSEGDPEAVLIDATTQTSYTDYVGDLMSAADKTYYYVRAIEASAGIDGKKQTANSTHPYIKRETLFFVPNAFTPKAAENNIFKPVCHFVRTGTYKMRIYNRYGTLLFSTTDIEEGWDGRYKGEFCFPDVYVYLIEYVNSDGEKEVRKGTVAVVD